MIVPPSFLSQLKYFHFISSPAHLEFSFNPAPYGINPDRHCAVKPLRCLWRESPSSLPGRTGGRPCRTGGRPCRDGSSAAWAAHSISHGSYRLWDFPSNSSTANSGLFLFWIFFLFHFNSVNYFHKALVKHWKGDLENKTVLDTVLSFKCLVSLMQLMLKAWVTYTSAILPGGLCVDLGLLMASIKKNTYLCPCNGVISINLFKINFHWYWPVPTTVFLLFAFPHQITF